MNHDCDCPDCRPCSSHTKHRATLGMAAVLLLMVALSIAEQLP